MTAPTGMSSAPAGMMAVNDAVPAPMSGLNEQDRLGQRSANDIAKSVLQFHQAGLDARREHDLLSEKYLLHVDGAGDYQWADILFGERVVIPRSVSEFRKTDNLLRLVVDNAVAHHTTMPFRFFAESPPDRAARDRALVDILFANHLSYQQDWNGLFADAMYMSMAAGFCPVHGYWRDETNDGAEPVARADTTAAPAVMPGMIDCFVGNPFDTVFDRGARRGSAHWCSYGRVLPADLVRRAWAHVPGVNSLEGTTRTPSASEFQKIAARWRHEGIGMHGYPVLTHRRHAYSIRDGEELMLIVCREVLPGYDAGWPDGRLQIIAVPGSTDLRWRDARNHAHLLVDQPLPGGDFSWSLFYSHHRSDDIHGKPWVEDIDSLQVDYNIARSKRWELSNKMAEAPIVAPGGAIEDDLADIGGYNILEIEPSLAGWRPQVMQWSPAAVQAMDREIDDTRNALFTAAGYQAASRGEAPGSRIAYRALVALQQADNTVHGPVNIRFQRSCTEFAGRMWRQMKAYGSVPWLVDAIGDEYAYLAEPYIDNAQMSDTMPRYKMVNAFGASPELRAQEVLDLMQTVGADGQPFLTTEEARREYPHQQMFDVRSHPTHVRKRRARVISRAFVDLARTFRAQTGFQETAMAHPWVQEAGQALFQHIEMHFPMMRDDDLDAHLSAYSEVTQDETVDPVARVAAMLRQNRYFEWQALMAQPQMVGAPAQGALPAGGSSDILNRRAIAAEMQGGAPVVDQSTEAQA